MTTGPDLAQALTDALAEKERVCERCEHHMGTELRFVQYRGQYAEYQYQCRCCVAEARLERARSMAAEIPKLERELTKAKETCG